MKKISSSKNVPEEKSAAQEKVPLVWAANGEKVDLEKVKRQPELREFWTKAYKNDEADDEKFKPQFKRPKRLLWNFLQ